MSPEAPVASLARRHIVLMPRFVSRYPPTIVVRLIIVLSPNRDRGPANHSVRPVSRVGAALITPRVVTAWLEWLTDRLPQQTEPPRLPSGFGSREVSWYFCNFY